MPVEVGRNKMEVFSYIKERVYHLVNSWGSKCLSKARREILIRSVGWWFHVICWGSFFFLRVYA